MRSSRRSGRCAGECARLLNQEDFIARLFGLSVFSRGSRSQFGALVVPHFAHNFPAYSMAIIITRASASSIFLARTRRSRLVGASRLCSVPRLTPRRLLHSHSMLISCAPRARFCRVASQAFLLSSLFSSSSLQSAPRWQSRSLELWSLSPRAGAGARATLPDLTSPALTNARESRSTS